MKKIFAIITAAVMLLAAAPGFAARGSADFTRFVAIGDSYGAGLESGSLNERHQPFSWPAVIARQAGAPDFQQPLVSFPGIGNELQLVNVVAFPPVITPAAGTGQPINATLPRPYNNLSVPGATVTDVITLKGNENPPQGTAQNFARFILRGLGTEVDQAIAQHPTFIAIWIGGNDLLGAVLSGTPKALTPIETFRTSYNTMLDRLVAGAPNAGMVVGNLPTNATAVPVINTVAPVLINPATRLPVLIGGNPVPLIAELGDGTVGALPTGSKVLLTASSKIGTGFGIPPQLAAVPPFNALPNVGKPLLDTDVLTPAEITEITNRAVAYNDIINTAATSRNIPVADIKGLFDRWSAGITVGPFVLNGAYVSGGLFSLDGFHLTDIGYTLFANEYIRTINANYDTEIPLAGLSQFFANNGAFPDDLGVVFVAGSPFQISAEAAKSIRMFANPVAGSRRLHAATHEDGAKDHVNGGARTP
ncbi:MAG TPA: SGNH/GDSL hydrolase family protein [Thermoanaerobaculia bacterium]|nr:SGNH/GDSL hydrolase family protein [Thermoanaerobaculia bacterium]